MRAFSRAALVGLLGLLLAPAAQAHHVPGATYKGKTTGGSKVEFKLSANGRRVTSFKLFGPIPGSPGGLEGTLGQCTITGSISLKRTGIENHFALGEGPSFEDSYAARFHRPRKARGTVEVVQNDHCYSPELRWTASTKASPRTTRACRRQRRRLKRAKQRLAEADNQFERFAARETLDDARRGVQAEC
jgi:hypothetical protein